MDRNALRYLVARHAKTSGITETPIEGLRLFRIDQRVARLPGISPPSLCGIVQGRKRAYLAGSAHTYDPAHYLCATMPLPVEAEVPEASPEEPVLGWMLDLETRTMAETLVAYQAGAGRNREPGSGEPTSGLVVAEVDEPFLVASGNLLALLDDPLARSVLATSRLRELQFILLQGPAGLLLRQTFGAGHDLTRALTYLRDHLSEHHTVADLARRAGMSPAVFHRRFKAATGFSPLQFLKALRLSAAAMEVVAGTSVGQAARSVGYTSPSQFSREFRRAFGNSPKQWARTAANSFPG